MFLGPFPALRAMLTMEFDSLHYTDDNEVCDEATTVARLFVIANDQIRIDYVDGRPSKVVSVIGARP